MVTDPVTRKHYPMATGLLDYFPDALAEVAHLSYTSNEQHNPGEPVHWAREKSTDHADALLRHLKDRGRRDTDGMLHSAKVAWRALALLQLELEAGSMVTRGEISPRVPDTPSTHCWLPDILGGGPVRCPDLEGDSPGSRS